MDMKVMKWMERLTCKDIVQMIDEMIINEYAKEWKEKMFKSRTEWLIREIYKIKHGYKKQNQEVPHIYSISNSKGYIIISFNNLKQVILKYNYIDCYDKILFNHYKKQIKEEINNYNYVEDNKIVFGNKDNCKIAM